MDDISNALGGTEGANHRRDLMQTCALATETELHSALAALAPLPEVSDVRLPETGLVMLRGRVGGDGGPFNVGEATVTRSVVRLDTGEVGYAYLLGRCARRARLAAIVDALGQSPRYAGLLEQHLVQPVGERASRERAARVAETAATRVEFFTLVRGEDSP